MWITLWWFHHIQVHIKHIDVFAWTNPTGRIKVSPPYELHNSIVATMECETHFNFQTGHQLLESNFSTGSFRSVAFSLVYWHYFSSASSFPININNWAASFAFSREASLACASFSILKLTFHVSQLCLAWPLGWRIYGEITSLSPQPSTGKGWSVTRKKRR